MSNKYKIKMYPSTEGEPTDAEGNPLPEAPGHRKERLEGLPVPVFQSTAAPPHPVDPGLLEGLTNCLEDAKRSLEGALANVSEIREDRERWLIATDMPINEEVQNMYGGGGMSPDAIKLDDAYYTIKRLLDDDLVASREVCEFVDAVERLIER